MRTCVTWHLDHCPFRGLDRVALLGRVLRSWVLHLYGSWKSRLLDPRPNRDHLHLDNLQLLDLSIQVLGELHAPQLVIISDEPPRQNGPLQSGPFNAALLQRGSPSARLPFRVAPSTRLSFNAALLQRGFPSERPPSEPLLWGFRLFVTTPGPH
uniref:Uncharacterized protein n=1 Tax=Knipowitschia caucasica TaxID=637954 RepID=A0AAV2L6E0_KNICA